MSSGGAEHGPDCERKAKAQASGRVKANKAAKKEDLQGPQAQRQKIGAGVPLTRRNSSGSMGAPNTTGKEAGGREAVQDTSIANKIALAKNWEPANKKHDPTGWIMSEKLDGVRCYWNGKSFYTRTGHMIFAPENFVKDLPVDMDLDGELWIDRGKFQEVRSS